MTLIDEMKAAAEGVTDGPWRYDGLHGIEQISMGPMGTGPLDRYWSDLDVVNAGYGDGSIGVIRECDGKFIAFARNNWSRIVAALEAANAALRRIANSIYLSGEQGSYLREIARDALAKMEAQNVEK